jgi:hypothetical protein
MNIADYLSLFLAAGKSAGLARIGLPLPPRST